MAETRSDWAWVRDVPSGLWIFLASLVLVLLVAATVVYLSTPEVACHRSGGNYVKLHSGGGYCVHG
jgi:hypothetical protein